MGFVKTAIQIFAAQLTVSMSPVFVVVQTVALVAKLYYIRSSETGDATDDDFL